MSRALGSVRDTARAQLWPPPVFGIVLAVLAAVALPHLDAYLDASLPAWLDGLLFSGDAGAARSLLDAISTSLITVTSLTFSLTVVTLQLASSQFSPRLLRTFTSDVVVQATLAVFLATFTYALTLLRAVRSPPSGAAFVPRIAVSVAFILGMVSVLCLVLFLAHLARQIRVETMLRDVHDEANATIRTATRALDEAQPSPDLLSRPSTAVDLTAPASGFVTSIDEPALLNAAVETDAYLVIDCHPGGSVVAGVPFGAAWGSAGPLAQDAVTRIRRAVAGALAVGYERTAAQDIGYGLRQLSDVANKALSPGINDPTTAIHALGHISAILCQLATRDLRSVLLCDADGQLRVVLHRPDFAEIVDTAITQPRRYGSSDPQVMRRLFGLLEELAWYAHDPTVVLTQLSRLRNTVKRSDFDDVERSQLEQAAVRVESAVAHRPQSTDEKGSVRD